MKHESRKSKKGNWMESDEDSLHETKIVTRGSLVSPLLTNANQCYNLQVVTKLPFRF